MDLQKKERRLRRRIKHYQREHESLRLALIARRLMAEKHDAETAALLCIRALETAYTREADYGLVDAAEHLHTRRILSGHTGNVTGTAFSPDGQFIASSSDDKTLRLWEKTSGECIRVFSGHTSPIRTVTFSPDGKSLLSGSVKEGIWWWDIATGEVTRVMDSYTHIIWDISFSLDGRYFLVAAWKNPIRMWDTATGALIQTYGEAHDFVYTASFSPDGQYGLSASNDGVAIWDIATGNMVRKFYSGESYCAAFSPDGETIAATVNDNRVQAWDTATGKNTAYFHWEQWSHIQSITNIAFTPDGHYLMTGSLDRMLNLWRMNGVRRRLFRGHTDPVQSFALSPDGKYMVSASDDGTLRLWDGADGGDIQVYSESPRGYYGAFALSADGKYLIAPDADFSLRLIDLATHGTVRSFRVNPPEEKFDPLIRSVKFTPDGHRFISMARDTRQMWLWDVATGTLLRTMELPDNLRVPSHWTFTADGQFMLMGGWNESVHVLNLMTGESVRQFEGGNFALSPDGRFIVTATSKLLRLWDFQTGDLVRIFQEDAFPIPGAFDPGVRFSPDGKHVFTADKVLRIWDTATGKLLRTFKNPGKHFDDGYGGFSPDGRYVLFFDHWWGIEIRDTTTHRLIRALPTGISERIGYLALSPDGQTLATRTDGIELWDIDYRKFIAYVRSRILRGDLTPDEHREFGIRADKLIR